MNSIRGPRLDIKKGTLNTYVEKGIISEVEKEEILKMIWEKINGGE